MHIECSIESVPHLPGSAKVLSEALYCPSLWPFNPSVMLRRVPRPELPSVRNGYPENVEIPEPVHGANDRAY